MAANQVYMVYWEQFWLYSLTAAGRKVHLAYLSLEGALRCCSGVMHGTEDAVCSSPVLTPPRPDLAFLISRSNSFVSAVDQQLLQRTTQQKNYLMKLMFPAIKKINNKCFVMTYYCSCIKQGAKL
ncbi:hypothetical protein ILYODFUR_039161 [Ilyodon furcidens]|uniref:Uncharacterized protein n=1 Tax=Ilyodon furcidens TaxID=33524 RepID=A0ABV0UYW0_9TELE